MKSHSVSVDQNRGRQQQSNHFSINLSLLRDIDEENPQVRKTGVDAVH